MKKKNVMTPEWAYKNRITGDAVPTLKAIGWDEYFENLQRPYPGKKKLKKIKDSSGDSDK